jgi:LCP family protein required for cell wall assembly
VNGGDVIYTVYRAGRDAPLRREVRRAGRDAPAAAAATAAAASAAAAPVAAAATAAAAPVVAATAGAAPPAVAGSPAVAAPPAAALPEPLAALSRRRGPRRAHPVLTAFVWLLAVAATAAVAVAFWYLGRQPLEDFWSVLDLAQATGEVPGWLLVGAPAVVAVAGAVVTAYLAFGHHLALKIVGLVVVTVVLAVPGFALGWTNGTLGDMGDRSTEVQAVVKHVRKKLQPPLPGEALNILLLGSDKRPEDPGRADTLLLVRLDPDTKSITMLSFPRDLYVELPGYGYDKINAAYPYGGAALCVETVGQLTGLPIHHFMEVDFGGFWHVVNILGGVYYPVDRRYYNPESSSWKSIDIAPGYQLLKGHDALDFVRYRHDARGDFSRMERQQTFLKELQRQSGRWNKDWKKVTKLLTAVTGEVTSDLDSLEALLPLASLTLTLNTSNVHMVRLEGSSQMMGDASYVVASDYEVQAAVTEFSNPTQAPVSGSGKVMPKKAYRVRVFNGSGVQGIAAATSGELRELGYNAKGVGNADSFDYTNTVVFAPKGMRRTAEQFVRLLAPAELRMLPRAPGMHDGITVVVGTSFDGSLSVPEPEEEVPTIVATEGRYDEASWQSLDARTPMKLQMPDVWASGLSYDEFLAYRVETPTGRQAAAAVAVATTPRGGYFSIQMMRWLDPPAIADPTTRKKIDGTTYLLFYNGADLHMVAWRRGNSLYWVLNTMDDELPADFMMALATSFSPLAAAEPDASSSPSPSASASP